jgi:hypothetical protein
MPDTKDSLDRSVRWLVYDATMRDGVPPASSAVAKSLGISPAEVIVSFERLAAARILVLQPESREILMAEPFSAVPTPFSLGDRKDVLVRKLHLGRAGNPRHDGQGRADRDELRRLRSSGHPPSEERQGARPGPSALRCSGASLVERHRLHLKDHAPLPVGRARRSLVRRLALRARRNPFPRAGLETGPRLVQPRSKTARLASPHSRRSRGAFCRAGADLAILEFALAHSEQ